MALRAGRVGVNPRIVDHNGNIKGMSCNTYTKEEIDQKLSGKANTSDVYTQSQVDTLLNGKADKSDTYTKDATNNILLDLLPDLFDTPPNVEASGNPLVLTDSAGGTAASCVVTLEPIQSGSGTPSPSNVRPISGRTEANVARTGKNLLDMNNMTGYTGTPTINNDGSLTVVATSASSVQQVLTGLIPSGTYTITNLSTSKSAYVQIGSGSDYSHTVAYNGGTRTFEYDGTSYLRILFNNQSASTTETYKMQLEFGSTATAYEAYNGESITRTYGTTIYGGTDDVTGEGVISEYGMVDLGSLNWFSGSGFFDTDVIPVEAATTDILCSEYPTNSAEYYIQHPSEVGIAISLSQKVRLYNSSYTTPNEVKTAVNGVMLAYKLATPTSIPLTAQNITLLHGDNVLTTAGTSIALSYPVDVASYIRRKLGMSTESTRALIKNLASEEIQEEVKEVSDLTPLEEVVEIKTVEPVETVTTTKTTKRTSTKK